MKKLVKHIYIILFCLKRADISIMGLVDRVRCFSVEIDERGTFQYIADRNEKLVV